MTLRISGIVKAANAIRQHLTQELPPDVRRQIAQNAAALVAQVDMICRQNKTSADRLPSPSKNAYNYLKTLDFSSLPQHQPATFSAGQSERRTAQPRVGNLVKISNHMTFWLAREATRLLDDPLREQTAQTLAKHVATARAICAGQLCHPAQLPPQSRAAFGYLAFLSEPRWLVKHVEAVVRIATLGQQEVHCPVGVVFGMFDHYFSLNESVEGVRLRFIEPMIVADDALFIRVFRSRHERRDPNLKTALSNFYYSAPALEVRRAMTAAWVDGLHQPRGQYHDLDAAFDRVNSALFSDNLPRPRLSWGGTITAQRFGKYDPLHDHVVISPTLDSPEVPYEAVDFVVFHELLHKVLGIGWNNGRRKIHTPEFRQFEQRFPRYAYWEAVLAELARRMK